MGQAPSAPQPCSNAYRADLPFDKLELFGLFAAGPIAPYAKQLIQRRGTDFTPDATFLGFFPTPAFQDILRSIKPRVARKPSPDRDTAYELLKRALDATHRHQFVSAKESFEQACQLAPNSATLHLAYAGGLLLSQNNPQGESEARLSMQLWPENAEAHAMVSLALGQQRRFGEAAKEAKEALRIFPEHRSAKFQLAVSLVQDQQYAEAISALRNAIAALPTVAVLQKFLGISLFQTGKSDEALEQLTQYVQRSPNDGEGHYYFGVVLRSKGRIEEAHAQFEEALRLQPDNAQFEAAAHPDAARNPASVAGPKPEDGSVSENLYTNRFFGFTYEFPQGWMVLSSDAARATLEIGGNLISTGDPTEQDIKRMAAMKGHPLLFIMEGRKKNQPLSLRSIQLSALEVGAAPGITPDTFLNAIAQRFKQTSAPMKMVGAPEQLTLAGKTFSKADFILETASGARYGSEIVTIERGYLLMFVLSSPDSDSLSEMERSLQSLQFAASSN